MKCSQCEETLTYLVIRVMFTVKDGKPNYSVEAMPFSTFYCPKCMNPIASGEEMAIHNLQKK